MIGRSTRWLLTIATLVQVPSAARAQRATSPVHIYQARFMTGCWAMQAGNTLVEEHWLAPRGGVMLGVGRTTRGDSLVESEFIRIYVRGDSLVYAAQPSGQSPAEFTAPMPNGTVVSFENRAHDFPQRIIYRRVGPDSLIARVEGTRNGVVRGIDYPYRRTACPDYDGSYAWDPTRASTAGSTPGCPAGATQPYFEFQVTTPARFRTSVGAGGPFPLNAPGAQMVGLVQFVVDTSGQVLPETFKTLNATDAAAIETARRNSADWRFHPATLKGCRVRQLMQSPLWR